MAKYTLITGASSGLGREIAILLSQEKNLILTARNFEKLEKTRALCKNNNDVIIWQYDLAKYKELESDFVAWKKEHQNIEIESLVYCAGSLQMIPVRNVTAEVLENTFAVNTFSPELMIKLLNSKKINKNNLNSVVLISSNISNRGAKAFSVYGASKAALDGVMRNLAMELAPKVRINSILPGGMKTEMTATMYDDEALIERSRNSYPMGLGTVKDVAPMVRFLLSDEASWITGQQFIIDGGRTVDLTE